MLGNLDIEGLSNFIRLIEANEALKDTFEEMIVSWEDQQRVAASELGSHFRQHRILPAHVFIESLMSTISPHVILRILECKKTLDLARKSDTNYPFPPLIVLPPAGYRLMDLRELNLSNNSIVAINHEIGELAQLVTLNLSRNRLRILPEEIYHLSLLKHLFLAGNFLCKLPDSKQWGSEGPMQWSQLNTLDLSLNSFEELPESFRFLKQLETLRLDSNRLHHLSELALLRLSHSAKLIDLSCNDIRILPASMFHENSPLLVLEIASNAIQQLPESIGRCKHLVRLNVSNNELEDLPVSMGYMHKGFDTLEIQENNSLNSDILQALKQGLPSLQALLRASEKPILSLRNSFLTRKVQSTCAAGALIAIRFQCVFKNGRESTSKAELTMLHHTILFEDNSSCGSLKDAPSEYFAQEVQLHALGRGSYELQLIPVKTGIFTVSICHTANVLDLLQGTPLKVQVIPGRICASRCTAQGMGLLRAQVGKSAFFTIIPRDSYGNCLHCPFPEDICFSVSMSGCSNEVGIVTPQEKGYVVRFTPKITGASRLLRVKQDSAHIAGSPFVVEVFALSEAQFGRRGTLEGLGLKIERTLGNGNGNAILCHGRKERRKQGSVTKRKEVIRGEEEVFVSFKKGLEEPVTSENSWALTSKQYPPASLATPRKYGLQGNRRK